MIVENTNRNKGREENNIYIPEWFFDDDRNLIVAIKLLNHVIEMQKSHRNLSITYKDLNNVVNCGLTPRTIEKFLGNISDVCKENGLPYVSGVVVNAETLMPGPGYFNYFYGIKRDDLESQMKQFKVDYKKISKCKCWKDLLDKLQK